LPVEEVVEQLQNNMSAPLILLENYPSSQTELNDFNAQVSVCEYEQQLTDFFLDC
jgi:hypothetical protein